MKNPVFILSLNDTAVYSARLLRKSNISILGFDHDRGNPGFYSRYITSFLAPHPQTDPQKLFEILLTRRKGYNLKPVLIAATESYLEFIFQNREALEEDFLFLLPPNEVLCKIINKSAQFELAEKSGILIPSYQIINSVNQLNTIGSLNYPVIIKGVDQPLWKKVIKKKTFTAKNKDELLSLGNYLLRQNVSFIIQKIIQGDCTNNFECNTLMANGIVIEQSVNQKIRQYPIDFGYGCCVKTTNNEEIRQLGTRFILENGIEGFSNTEFKKDPESGKYYFIETNARVWSQIELTNKAGQNFVLSYYYLLSKEKQVFKSSYSNSSLRWVDLPTDLLVFIRYRHQIGLSIWDFLKSIFSASNFGLLSFRDIRPFIRSIWVVK